MTEAKLELTEIFRRWKPSLSDAREMAYSLMLTSVRLSKALSSVHLDSEVLLKNAFSTLQVSFIPDFIVPSLWRIKTHLFLLLLQSSLMGQNINALLVLLCDLLVSSPELTEHVLDIGKRMFSYFHLSSAVIFYYYLTGSIFVIKTTPHCGGGGVILYLLIFSLSLALANILVYR